MLSQQRLCQKLRKLVDVRWSYTVSQKKTGPPLFFTVTLLWPSFLTHSVVCYISVIFFEIQCSGCAWWVDGSRPAERGEVLSLCVEWWWWWWWCRTGDARPTQWRALSAVDVKWLGSKRTCDVCASGASSLPSSSVHCLSSSSAVPPSPSPTTNTRSLSR